MSNKAILLTGIFYFVILNKIRVSRIFLVTVNEDWDIMYVIRDFPVFLVLYRERITQYAVNVF